MAAVAWRARRSSGDHCGSTPPAKATHACHELVRLLNAPLDRGPGPEIAAPRAVRFDRPSRGLCSTNASGSTKPRGRTPDGGTFTNSCSIPRWASVKRTRVTNGQIQCPYSATVVVMFGLSADQRFATGAGEQIVDVHTTAPEGCWIVGICNFGNGDEIFDMKPVNPAGFEMLAFPMAHPDNRIELVAADGIEVLRVLFVGGGIEGLVEYD